MVSPKTLFRALNLKPKKSLGQNFLCDPHSAETIVRRCGLSGRETVLEIGAGTGALTIPAARQAAAVYAIETDGRLIDILEETIQANRLDNVIVSRADFMKMDLTALFRSIGTPLTIIGNLPYHLSSQILVRLINHREMIDRAVLMFQQELALRLTAPPGGRDYGRLTVMLRYCADTTSLLRLKPQLFFPRPAVDSEVIRIVFKKPTGPAECPDDLLFRIIKAAFAKRRKTIKNTLSSSDLGLSPVEWEEILGQAGVSPGQRAEVLDARHYVDICRYYQKMIGFNPPSGPS